MEGGPNIQEADNLSSSSEDGARSKCVESCVNPRGTLHRVLILALMSFLGFGSFFCYDNPAALEDHIKRDLNITVTEYTMLYSMYSWPNVVLCFIGGFLIDSVFGIRLGTNIFMGLLLLGQLIVAGGAFANCFWLMILGRFVFGVGGESLAIAQNNYAVLWFKGRELNMVFGFQMSFARVGSTVNFLVMESVYQSVNKSYQGPVCLGISLFIATLTCGFSMLCALVLGCLDKRAEVVLRRHETASQEVVRLTDVKDFKLTFWLIAMICVFYFVAIFPFIGLAKGFFTSQFHMTNHEANTLISLIYLLSGIVSPFLGLLVDKFGKNISWVMVAILVTILSHSLLGFTSLNPYIGIVLMGISYSCLASSLLSLVPLIIPEYQLGTAYGVSQAVQNLGLAVFTYVAGAIVKQYGYMWLEVFFIITLSVSLMMTITLWIRNTYEAGTLNLSPRERTSTTLEQEKLLSDAEGLETSTDVQIQNRYLSRIGAPIPSHHSVILESD